MIVSGGRTLGETLAQVRSRIGQLRERAARGERVGEQNTKAILIEPLLAALGWDLSDLDDVRREYRRKDQDNPVDYALLAFGRPRARPCRGTGVAAARDHRPAFPRGLSTARAARHRDRE